MPGFDVLVVGAGHAGCEAAWAAARLGCRVGLCTLSVDRVAHMPCNPAIGGTAKGHLVREIDALGGVMGRAIDATGLQFKMLNRSRGPAVWSPRAQADKRRYSAWVRAELSREPSIEWIEGRIEEVLVSGWRVTGLRLDDGTRLEAPAVVITTGTFLNGLIHIGDERLPAGRFGEPPAKSLAASLKSLGLRWGRLKTGTPPRVHRRSIDVSRLVPQHGDDPPAPFSFVSERVGRDQVVCHLLHTNERVHDLVRANIERSPLYNGRIEGIGPRYCPSLEDKVMRFPDRERHQIFLEPEGLDVDEIYVNGLSMSLPSTVQVELVRSLPGLEAADVMRPGYAVEYDFVQPIELRRTLETKAVRGLFLAGQINGTSGYEEAGAQGLLAGISASLTAKGREPVVLGRADAYIGVMIDDLTTQGCLEPYRMFTSRAEFRLLLRADNADARLTPLGRRVGLVDDERWRRFEARQEALDRCRARLASVPVRVPDGNRVPAAIALRRPGVWLKDLIDANSGLIDQDSLGELDLLTVETDIKYEGYLRRQAADVARAARGEHRPIPPGWCYAAVPGLSREVRERLSQVRPETLGQAARVPGVTPAAVAILARRLDGAGPKRAGGDRP